MLAKAHEQANEEVEDLVAMIEENEMLAAEMEGAIDQMIEDQEIANDEKAEETPEEVRREAIRKVSGLQDRLDEILDGDKAKMDAALRDALANLQVSNQGDEDAEALATPRLEQQRSHLDQDRHPREQEQTDQTSTARRPRGGGPERDEHCCQPLGTRRPIHHDSVPRDSTR